jgi:hypothetical protein
MFLYLGIEALLGIDVLYVGMGKRCMSKVLKKAEHSTGCDPH